MVKNMRLRVAYLSTFPPRQCGLATFTQDLTAAINDHGLFEPARIIAMINGDARQYPANVRFLIREDDPDDYVKAAEYVHKAGIDLVSLQHEFGIFGGEDGEYILRFLRACRVPVIATMHTILQRPSPRQRRIVREIAKHSQVLVSLCRKGVDFLTQIYGVPRDRLVHIPHGVPVPPNSCPDEAKRKLGLEGRQLITSFGLIGPGKGIEVMLKAMRDVVRACPRALYLVLGRTHPRVQRQWKESYREWLVDLARQLGISDYVRFVNRYLTRSELLEYLVASDVVVTPHLSREQVSSGTLTYALALGKAIVSTPFHYAVEMLAGRKGLLARFADPRSLAECVRRILTDSELRRSLEQGAARTGRRLFWPSVAWDYCRLFSQVMAMTASAS